MTNQYSRGLVYNTFPLPSTDKEALLGLEPLAQAILDVRAEHPEATLADLYDPDAMPPNLRKAHQALDRAVDRLYRRSGFRVGTGAGRAPPGALRKAGRAADGGGEAQAATAKAGLGSLPHAARPA